MNMKEIPACSYGLSIIRIYKWAKRSHSYEHYSLVGRVMATIDVGKGSEWECGGEWGCTCIFVSICVGGWVSGKGDGECMHGRGECNEQLKDNIHISPHTHWWCRYRPNSVVSENTAVNLLIIYSRWLVLTVFLCYHVVEYALSHESSYEFYK